MRRRTRGFPRSSKFQKKQMGWDASIHIGTVLDDTGTITELTLCTPQVIVGNSGQNQRVKLRRVIGQFAVFPTLEVAATTQGIMEGCWAVYTIDVDDTDASLVTTAAGGILASERVLQMGYFGQVVHELPTAQMGTVLYDPCRIDFDVKSQCWIRPDQALIFGLQLFGSIAGITTAITVSGVSRTLFEQP